MLHFKRFADFRQMRAAEITAAFPLFLRDDAIEWYENLPAATKADVSQLMNSFKKYLCKSQLDALFDAESAFTRAQQPSESVHEYVAQMRKLSKRIPDLDDKVLLTVVIRGCYHRSRRKLTLFNMANLSQTLTMSPNLDRLQKSPACPLIQ